MVEQTAQRQGGAESVTPEASCSCSRPALRSLGIVVAALAGLYGALALVLPARVFWSPDEGAKLLQALSWKRGGARAADLPYGGRDLDPTLTFYPRLLPPRHPAALLGALYPQPTADGGVRFHWPVVFPLASLVPYRVLGPRGLYLLPLLGGLGAAAAAGALGRAVDRSAAVPCALAVGLSSPILFYSQLFWEHAPAAALCLMAVLTLTAAPPLLGPRLLVAAAALAGAVVLRAESLLLVAVVPLTVALTVEGKRRSWSWPRARGWILPAAVLALAVTVVGLWSAAGLPLLDWLQGRLSVVMSLLGVVARGRGLLSPVPNRLAEAWFDLEAELGPVVPGPLVWVGTVGALVALGAAALHEPARGWAVAAGGCLVLVPSVWTLLSAEPYRSIHALLLPAPYLALAALLLRPPPAARGRPAFFLGSTAALYLLLGTTLAMTKMVGGLEWGNRYLLPLTALGAVVAAAGAVAYGRRDGERRPRVAVVFVTAACLATGALYQVRGVREVLVAKRGLEACRLEVLEAHGPVVTDLYWLPAAMADVFPRRPLFTLSARDDLGRWLDRVGGGVSRFRVVTAAAGPDEVQRWLQSLPTHPLQLAGMRSLAGLQVADVELREASRGGGE
jgi:hypothetical protein